MPEKQSQEYPVTVEVGGKRYTGFYAVSFGVVTGELRAHAGPKAARTARLLFREILLTAMHRSKC